MYMKDEKIVEIDDYRLELENRIRNLLWTISGDYTLNMKVDVSLYLRSKAIALYDGIKQGALAKYYDRNLLGLYLVKKVFCQAGEGELTAVAQLCVEEAIGDKICQERPGVREMQKEAFEDILDQEFEQMPAYGDILGRLKIAILRDRLQNGNHYVEERLRKIRDMVYKARTAADTIELIRIIDGLYNTIIDPNFEKDHGTLEQVMAVTMEELTEYDWEDFLTEELYEEALESYIEQMTNKITDMEDTAVTEEMEKQRQTKHKITILTEEELEKAYTYVELNFGKTYLTPAEEKRMNYLMCRELHRDCSLYFTEGILKNPVKRNYQYEYAVRLKNKNIWLYHDKHRIVKQNIASLTDLLRKTLVLKSEMQEVLSDRGTIIPSRLWRVGRSSEANLFKRELKSDASDFVVDVLIDASGSQMSRQGDVALQAYIISEALSNVNLPHRVMSFCTFWDYTILHRFREYDDPQSANENIFNYKNHLTHGRVRSLLDNILLSRPCFTILSNSLKIIIYAMFMRHAWFMSVWHPFICRQSLFMTMIVIMVMVVMMFMIMIVVMVMIVVMMVMMTATMAMMMFTMAMVMGIFIFHVFTHFKPPRGLRRPTANNKKTYSSSI